MQSECPRQESGCCCLITPQQRIWCQCYKYIQVLLPLCCFCFPSSFEIDTAMSPDSLDPSATCKAKRNPKSRTASLAKLSSSSSSSSILYQMHRKAYERIELHKDDTLEEDEEDGNDDSTVIIDFKHHTHDLQQQKHQFAPASTGVY